jgi:hypothetical protein
MNKRNDFDDRSENPREDRHRDQSEDTGDSTNNDYNRKGDGSFSETPRIRQRQQSEDTNETDRIERLKKD